MDKKDIIEVLEFIGTMMEIKGENPFKIRAYFSGARTLQTMEEDLGTVIEEGRVSEVPGIGKALTEKIETLFATGELEFYDKLLASVPPGLLDLLDVPGLGGKKIKALHEQLDADSIESLTEACNEGKVAQLKGFGEKTQEKILSGIKNREAYAARHLWWQARKSPTGFFPACRTCLRSSVSKRPGACAGEWKRSETSTFWSPPPILLRSWIGSPPWRGSPKSPLTGTPSRASVWKTGCRPTCGSCRGNSSSSPFIILPVPRTTTSGCAKKPFRLA